jgi:VacB/RNase II family 3'-5' exoribonuclease
MTSKTPKPDLRSIAVKAMINARLITGFSPEALLEAGATAPAENEVATGGPPRDMRGLLWSSIDNKESRDLDQVEYVERLPGGRIRLLVGIADVDAFAPKGSAIDRHAFINTVSVYTPAITFHMLPEQLSTGLTSLLEGEDRLALVIDLVLTGEGAVSTRDVYRAVVRNHARLNYEEVGSWLENRSPIPGRVAKVPGLEEQIRLQAETTDHLHLLRRQNGALELETVETEAVLSGEEVVGLEIKRHNRARDIIENFMIAANTAMAEFLQERGVPSLRRVVRAPERWNLMVKMARSYGFRLPLKPDVRALADFLVRRKSMDPAGYTDLSLSVLKMMGSGEYMVEAPGLDQEGHFGLAVDDYTHSTAPNRRYPDLVTQRCLKAAVGGKDFPYSRTELEEIALRCNRMEDAARKVERTTKKAAVAVLLSGRIGEAFDGIVTGVKEKGTFVQLVSPPAEGLIVEGEEGLSVGEKVRVRLVSTEPELGFIDFATVT